MGLLGSLILYVLIVAGFILAAWATNGIFNSFRKKDEEGPFDALFALMLWEAFLAATAMLFQAFSINFLAITIRD